MKPATIEPGTVFKGRYPFCIVGSWFAEGDGDGKQVPSWKPGIDHTRVAPDDVEPLHDGEGFIKLTVVDVHKPGDFPTRVFYIRTWIDPQGKEFGKPCLRITTLGHFRRLAQGWRHRTTRSITDVAADLAKELGITPEALWARMGCQVSEAARKPEPKPQR